MTLDEMIDLVLVIGVVFGVGMLFSASTPVFIIGTFTTTLFAILIEKRGEKFMED